MQFKLFTEILLNENVIIKEGKKIEASLDCHICQRINRTFIFQPDKLAFCRKGGHAISGDVLFCQKHLSKADNHYNLSEKAQKVTLEYQISFDYQEFTDKETQIASQPATYWSRVFFSLRCPVCNSIADFSTQTNLKRIVEFRCKKCNHLLALDTTEQPTYEYME